MNRAETKASFHCSGNIPRDRLLLNKYAKGVHKEDAHFLSSLLLMPSGPIAFDVSSSIRTLFTISGVISIVFSLVGVVTKGGGRGVFGADKSLC